MFLLSRVVCVVLLQSTTGNYCSLNDTKINCVPCVHCLIRGLICYGCPNRCGKLNNCKTVCALNCRHGTCEYMESDSVPVCTKGCVQGFTGKQCQEYCSEGCKECDQESGNCMSCMEGFKGENCNLPILSFTSAAPSPSASMRECANECDFCNDTITVCEKCTDASKCHNPCGCNELRLTTNHTLFELTPPPPKKSTVTSFDKTEARIEGSFFWYQTSIITAAVAMTVAVAAVLVICIAVICYRKRSTYRGIKRNNQQLSAMEWMPSPADNASAGRMDSDSDPYACIAVFDRDCVPEHLFQAAMVTAPQIVTCTSSPFN